MKEITVKLDRKIEKEWCGEEVSGSWSDGYHKCIDLLIFKCFAFYRKT